MDLVHIVSRFKRNGSSAFAGAEVAVLDRMTRDGWQPRCRKCHIGAATDHY